MQVGLPNRFLQFGVPQHDIRIEAHADRALARIEAVDACMVSRGQLDEFLQLIRPFDTPSENRIGSRVSTPGMPFGTQRNEVRPFGVSLPMGRRSETGSGRTRRSGTHPW